MRSLFLIHATASSLANRRPERRRGQAVVGGVRLKTIFKCHKVFTWLSLAVRVVGCVLCEPIEVCCVMFSCYRVRGLREWVGVRWCRYAETALRRSLPCGLCCIYGSAAVSTGVVP